MRNYLEGVRDPWPRNHALHLMGETLPRPRGCALLVATSDGVQPEFEGGIIDFKNMEWDGNKANRNQFQH